MQTQPFEFLDAGPLIDGGLELVQPAIRWVDDVLAAQRHPLTVAESPHLRDANRQFLLDFLVRFPGGRSMGDTNSNSFPRYYFWMHLRPGFDLGRRPPVAIGGGIGLRIGSTWEIEQLFGHIGYNVYPPARGHHLAERATRLLLPLARRHGMQSLWITCNPDNGPSRRTCERLGARLIETVPVPRDHPLYAQGDHEKCRYLLAI